MKTILECQWLKVSLLKLSLVLVQLLAPGVEVTVYPVTGEPPSLVGAVQDTAADLSPAVAVTPVGALGTVRGVTLLEGGEAGEVPAVLVAVVVNV